MSAGAIIFTEENNLVARGLAVILYPAGLWFALRWAVSRHAPENAAAPSDADARNSHGEDI